MKSFSQLRDLFTGAMGPDSILMIDNAIAHTARVVIAYLDHIMKESMSWIGQLDHGISI